jgi:hypothetical protein
MIRLLSKRRSESVGSDNIREDPKAEGVDGTRSVMRGTASVTNLQSDPVPLSEYNASFANDFAHSEARSI